MQLPEKERHVLASNYNIFLIVLGSYNTMVDFFSTPITTQSFPTIPTEHKPLFTAYMAYST